MYARHITAIIRPEKVDEALKLYEESVVPEGRDQNGYRGLFVLTDRESGKVVSITLWDSKEDAAANEDRGYLHQQIDKFKDYLLEPVVREGFEVGLIFSKTK
jgi:heme-degrading monooxygenase HmoA